MFTYNLRRHIYKVLVQLNEKSSAMYTNCDYFTKLWITYCDTIIIDLQLNCLRWITNGFFTIELSIECLSIQYALFEILGIFRKKLLNNVK